MAADSAIWQVQASAIDGQESTATSTNTIEFNNDPVTATGNYVYDTEILMRNSAPENTSLSGGTNSVEDMGQDGLDIQVTGEFKNGQTDIDKFVRFWKEPKTTTGYTKGRFGLRVPFPTNFNKDPTVTYGYLIVNPRLIISGETKKIAGFVVTLRMGGDVPDAI